MVKAVERTADVSGGWGGVPYNRNLVIVEDSASWELDAELELFKGPRCRTPAFPFNYFFVPSKRSRIENLHNHTRRWGKSHHVWCRVSKFDKAENEVLTREDCSEFSHPLRFEISMEMGLRNRSSPGEDLNVRTW